MKTKIFLSTLMAAACALAGPDDTGRIQPFADNPFYWQYQGRPVLLLGASDDDNLFQWHGQALTDQLDQLVSCGGNFIRNTMSSRDEGNVFPFAMKDGRFDLDHWNEIYWKRFETLLAETHRRGVIVQIELFDLHDMINPALWNANPWNPRRNINYTFRNTGLPRRPAPLAYRDGESVGEPHPFFLSIPAANDDAILLDYQRRYVDRVLEHTFRHDHVLYCISNEIHTEYPPQWGMYWAQHLRKRADEAGKRIEITEMHWALDLTHPSHRVVLARPEVFTFFEASQNSTNTGRKHWDQLQFVRNELRERPRPINHTKIYGADTAEEWAGVDRDAEERFWRNIIGGSASARFHRPPYGLGLGPKAQQHIRSMRMLTDAMNVFTCEPADDLLAENAPNEAYCLAGPGRQYAVYFPDGGAATLDLRAAKESLELRWLDIARGEWRDTIAIGNPGKLELEAPAKGHWAALITNGS